MVSQIKVTKSSSSLDRQSRLVSQGDTITLPSTATLTNFPNNTPAFFAYASSNTDIASDTNTKIALNSEYYDTDNAFDTSNYRFTVPSGEGGKYQISFCYFY